MIANPTNKCGPEASLSRSDTGTPGSVQYKPDLLMQLLQAVNFEIDSVHGTPLPVSIGNGSILLKKTECTIMKVPAGEHSPRYLQE